MKSINLRDNRYRHIEDHLRELITDGKLPGKWGLLQDLLGHWAIPNDERGALRYGKAFLDTVGTVLAYRAEQRQRVEGTRNPTRLWLRDNGYFQAFPGQSGLQSFVADALSDHDFSERKIKGPIGQADHAILLEFSLGDGPAQRAFFLDPTRQKGVGTPGMWFGPYCRPQDRPALDAFVRETVWETLDSRTLVLESRQESLANRCPAHLAAVSDDFDFASALDAFNDVPALARRCQAFLASGRSRTVLFHGPPGTGKSTLGRALARELDARLVLISCDAVTSLADATTLSLLALLRPGVIVLNDIDRVESGEHLALLQGLEQVTEQPRLVVLTVNDLAQLDPAILRPGRVHELREIPEPSPESRDVILTHYLERFGIALAGEQRDQFLARSDSFSPADVREFCETAAAVGVDLALEELGRIEAQRKLYAGDSCQAHNVQDPQRRRFRNRRVPAP